MEKGYFLIASCKEASKPLESNNNQDSINVDINFFKLSSTNYFISIF